MGGQVGWVERISGVRGAGVRGIIRELSRERKNEGWVGGKKQSILNLKRKDLDGALMTRGVRKIKSNLVLGIRNCNSFSMSFPRRDRKSSLKRETSSEKLLLKEV